MSEGEAPEGDADDKVADLLLVRLRARDAMAFRSLLRELHRPMIALARSFVKSREIAEEVVQDTWVAVVAGLDGFEQRSSLKAWIFNILVNKARTRGARDGRIPSFSDLERDGEPAVSP